MARPVECQRYSVATGETRAASDAASAGEDAEVDVGVMAVILTYAWWKRTCFQRQR